MSSWFINSEAKDFGGVSPHPLWFQHGIACTSGGLTYANKLAKLQRGDTCYLYANRLGVVAVGEVDVPTDGQPAHPPLVYCRPDQGAEYQAKVRWYLRFPQQPIPPERLLALVGRRNPRHAVEALHPQAASALLQECEEKLRESARLEEIGWALAEQLEKANQELLRRVMALGVTLDTAQAFLLAPLVQVAWAEGEVTEQEHKTVLRLASTRGVEESSPAHGQLLAWLQERPPDALFDMATEVIKVGLSVLTPAEREERITRIVQACDEVAEASGGLARLLGLGSGVSGEDESLLDTITTTLRDHRRLEKDA